jgi:hypothetical protein
MNAPLIPVAKAAIACAAFYPQSQAPLHGATRHVQKQNKATRIHGLMFWDVPRHGLPPPLRRSLRRLRDLLRFPSAIRAEALGDEL